MRIHPAPPAIGKTRRYYDEKKEPPAEGGSQTVDKPCFAKEPSRMGGCEGGRESPCTFNLRKNRNIFQCFGFCFSSCRHFVDSLKPPPVSGGGFCILYGNTDLPFRPAGIPRRCRSFRAGVHAGVGIRVSLCGNPDCRGAARLAMTGFRALS